MNIKLLKSLNSISYVMRKDESKIATFWIDKDDVLESFYTELYNHFKKICFGKNLKIVTLSIGVSEHICGAELFVTYSDNNNITNLNNTFDKLFSYIFA